MKIRSLFKTTFSLRFARIVYTTYVKAVVLVIYFLFPQKLLKRALLWQGAVWSDAEAQSEPPFLHQSVSIFCIVFSPRCALLSPNKFAVFLCFYSDIYSEKLTMTRFIFSKNVLQKSKTQKKQMVTNTYKSFEKAKVNCVVCTTGIVLYIFYNIFI